MFASFPLLLSSHKDHTWVQIWPQYASAYFLLQLLLELWSWLENTLTTLGTSIHISCWFQPTPVLCLFTFSSCVLCHFWRIWNVMPCKLCTDQTFGPSISACSFLEKKSLPSCFYMMIISLFSMIPKGLESLLLYIHFIIMKFIHLYACKHAFPTPLPIPINSLQTP